MPIIFVQRRAALLGVLCIALVASGLFAVRSVAEQASPKVAVQRVQAGEEFVGYAASAEDVRQAVDLLEERESTRRGYPVAVSTKVATNPVEVDESVPVLNPGELADRLSMSVSLRAEGVQVVIDGRPVMVLSSEEAARQAVEQLIEEHRIRLEQGDFPAPGRNRLDEQVEIESIEPVEEISYRTVVVSPEQLRHDVNEAVTVLARGTDELVTHEVQPGESLWTIARNNDLTVAELQEANPEISDPTRIRPGDELSLVVPAPYITLRSVETRRFGVRIPFTTRLERDPDLFPWEEVVKQEGVYGLRQVVERVERVSGKIVQVTTLEDEVVAEPQVQVVVRGSKTVPDMGTGSFRWPMDTGQVTDSYGWSRWRGRQHNGIDIAAPSGTPVYAADTGVVVAAGWDGGYGRVVKLDHGGGKRVTLYAHLSSISVSEGDRVTKGQKIGSVGTSGFTTGPHLHFEVLIDGRSVDPTQYYASR